MRDEALPHQASRDLIKELIEVMDLTGAVWRVSSRSGNGGATCVEVATNLTEVVGVRDSTDRRGPVLTFTPAAWAVFARAVSGGALASRP